MPAPTASSSPSQNSDHSKSHDDLSFVNSAAGKAYQAVAQSTAIAIQDAVDYLRNMEIISSSAIGSALAKSLDDPSEIDAAKEIIDMAQNALTKSVSVYKEISMTALEILNSTPSGVSK